jgi:hypothetical protein
MTSNTEIHDLSLSFLGTGTSIKSDRFKLVLLARNRLLVTQCIIVLIRKSIGSIKFISGEAASPDMKFIDPIVSVLGQLYTV